MRWKHPGGKLRELGPEHLSEEELLAIVIGSGAAGRSAQDIAREIIQKYGSIFNLSGRWIDELCQIKGISDAKAIRIAAVLEIARRAVAQTYKKQNSLDNDYRWRPPKK